MANQPSTPTTAELIGKIATANCIPVTHLRAHWTELGALLTAHLKRQDAEIERLKRAPPA